MSYEDKARELGMALLDCDETTILRAAETAIESDPEAQMMIRDFQQKQKEISGLQEADEEISDELIERFNALQDKMKENKTLQSYFSAQASFQTLLQNVNLIINQVLSGSSCSADGCDGCDGCC